ncbi:hypothetical protein ACFPC0_25585 [Streptomyces andamanensis]|uniref:Uncharacterized protein n=1 Tax=Streptomyces andamanensis TaxID=1565035 RepID=A0ABV8TK79_9ACTN
MDAAVAAGEVLAGLAGRGGIGQRGAHGGPVDDAVVHHDAVRGGARVVEEGVHPAVRNADPQHLSGYHLERQ